MFTSQNNRVIQHTGARYPVFQAPMAWIARAPLVSAVSIAGGIGLLESSSRDVSALRRELAAVRTITDRPFGINLAIKFLRSNEELEREVLEVVVNSGVRFVTTSAGDPRRYAQRLKEAGIVVYHAVPSLDGALKAVDAGVDGLIVEGGESAGIRGAEPVHSLVLLQAIRERVGLPIVAAGGIADGRGMAAAFALGAEGVAMGTRFVASIESPVHANYKQAIVDALPNGTLSMPFPPGATSRVLRTDLARRVAAGECPPGRAQDMVRDLYTGGRIDLALGSAGESAGLIRDIKSVKDIIEETVSGFWCELDRLSALRDARPDSFNSH
jgi:enoyl-[acyl-carrier protein] reductase II